MQGDTYVKELDEGMFLQRLCISNHHIYTLIMLQLYIPILPK